MQLDKLQREIKVGSPVVFHDGSKSANLKIGTVARTSHKIYGSSVDKVDSFPVKRFQRDADKKLHTGI